MRKAKIEPFQPFQSVSFFFYFQFFQKNKLTLLDKDNDIQISETVEPKKIKINLNPR